MLELRADIRTFAEAICVKLRTLPYIQSANVVKEDDSKCAGLSTYINVVFKKPVGDRDYLHKYKEGYQIKIRLSDHYNKTLGLEDYDIDMCYKVFAEFEQDVLNLVEEHDEMLNDLWQDWQNTNVKSKLMKYINKRKAIKRNYVQNKGRKRGNYV